MASTEPPKRYGNFPEAIRRHREIYDKSLLRPLQPVLPPGLSQAQFDKAIDQLVAVLGPDSVFVKEALRDYVDPFEIWEIEGERRVPSAAVLPRSLEQLKSVLKVVNELKIPVWTFSQGKNFGYGGPAPIVNGSIALDLHRMNKIIEVDDKLCYAVVEPGVTFKDMFDHCIDNDLNVWPGGPSLPWGSIIGNTLDRGMGYLPTGVHHQQIAGLEVLLATGEVVRTGQFAINGSKSAHVSKHSFGPSLEGLFLQSNLGIVTKMGVWLTPRPESYMFCTFDMPEMEDLATIVDVLGPLRRSGVIDATLWVASASEFVSIMNKRAEVWDGDGPIPIWRLKELMKPHDMGLWTAHFGFYGPTAVIQAHFDEVQRVTKAKAPTGWLRGKLFSGKSPEIRKSPLLLKGTPDMFVGKPTFTSMKVVKFNIPIDGSGSVTAHRDYSPIIPADGKKVLEWAETSRKICEGYGFDLFCDFFIQERSVIFIYLTTFDKANPKHREVMNRLGIEFAAEARKRGLAVYRSHINEMDRNAEAFDFNNYAYRRFVEKLKDTLDPEGILSPGKQGIWPKRFRGEGKKPTARL